MPPQLALGEPVGTVEVEPAGLDARPRPARPGARAARWRCPTPSAARHPRAPSTISASRSGAASSSACLIASSSVDAEAGQVSQLPSRRDPGDAVLDLQQLDVAAVATPCRGGRCRAPRPPGLERHRVEVVDQHQAGDKPVVWRAARSSSAPASPGVDERGEDPLQALAVELEHAPHQLLGARRGPPGRRAARAARSAPGRGRPAPPGAARARPPRRRSFRCVDSAMPTCSLPSSRLSTSPWACAGPCAPCRRRRTCGRRTAGTGRSSAPPA